MKQTHLHTIFENDAIKTKVLQRVKFELKKVKWNKLYPFLGMTASAKRSVWMDPYNYNARDFLDRVFKHACSEAVNSMS